MKSYAAKMLFCVKYLAIDKLLQPQNEYIYNIDINEQ